MTAIWASLGDEPPISVMHRVAHRGAIVGRRTFLSPAGQLHLCQGDYSLEGPQAGPTTLESERSWIVFDGVLYNRDELDDWIGDAQVCSDAQRVLTMFERESFDGLHRLTGMFAFVIWNDDTKCLHAVRDRFGMKPLYLYQNASGLAFASEIKQFLALPHSCAKLDLDVSFDFLVAGLTDHRERTLFADVTRIPAGTCLEFNLGKWNTNSPPNIQEWYRLPTPNILQIDESKACEDFRQIFTQAVHSQWQQPGSKALCLSGGLDSAAIAGVLGKHCATPFTSFKVFFGDPVYDEPELLDAVLTGCHAINHVTHTKAHDAFRLIDKLVWHLDEPFGRASLAAQWMLFEFAASHGVRATLDGQGSDEQLCGYMSMLREHQAYLAGTSITGGNSADSSRSNMQHTDAMSNLYACFAAEWRGQLAKHVSSPNLHAKPLGELCRERMLHGDLPMMMRHNDRIGAAHGIQTHVPYMDHRLVEFSIALGDKHKLSDDETKLLLRRAFADMLPQSLLDHRGKGSYASLEVNWLTREDCNAALREAVQRTVHEWPQLFSAGGVEQIFSQSQAHEKERLMLLWRIACFGSWARCFTVSM